MATWLCLRHFMILDGCVYISCTVGDSRRTSKFPSWGHLEHREGSVGASPFKTSLKCSVHVLSYSLFLVQ